MRDRLSLHQRGVEESCAGLRALEAASAALDSRLGEVEARLSNQVATKEELRLTTCSKVDQSEFNDAKLEMKFLARSHEVAQVLAIIFYFFHRIWR